MGSSSLRRATDASCATPATLLLFALLLFASSLEAQAPKPAFRFSHAAGQSLQALWSASMVAHQERVACLAATIRNDTVLVTRILPLEPDSADSLSISSTASIDRCGPPEWSGTVHTHVAEYANGNPSARFSAQDRRVMRMWYERWHADGVFCLAHSARDAHCEADGVVGGVRSRPQISP